MNSNQTQPSTKGPSAGAAGSLADQTDNRALDALVAERVMLIPVPQFHAVAYVNGVRQASIPLWDRYSSELTAAGLVLEKMRERGFTWVLEQEDAKGMEHIWHADIWKLGENTIHRATEDSLPKAICRAALYALNASK